MKERFISIISKYVPSGSVDYCVKLWEAHPFSFKVTRERRSKLGDYRFHKQKRYHIITVNGNLNPYGFLITYIHEVAHMIHYELKGNNQPPHGKYWKNIFRELMKPVLHAGIFPPDLMESLSKHMKNPRASSYSDTNLAKKIKKYDPVRHTPEYFLEELDIGDTFRLHGKTYEKIQKRRTRSLCRDLHSGKKYLISEMAMVRKIQP
jgi:hypothetical protein